MDNSCVCDASRQQNLLQRRQCLIVFHCILYLFVAYQIRRGPSLKGYAGSSLHAVVLNDRPQVIQLFAELIDGLVRLLFVLREVARGLFDGFFEFLTIGRG